MFFLDVYGSGRFRGAPYRELCEGLLERGQDIQLHTHPDQMYDSKRRNMHEYSLAEQTGIVRDGMALLKDTAEPTTFLCALLGIWWLQRGRTAIREGLHLPSLRAAQSGRDQERDVGGMTWA